MSNIIPKEETGSFKRWQIGSFDPPKTAPEAQPAKEAAVVLSDPLAPAQPAPSSAEEIERIYEEARNRGYQAGYEEGSQAAKASAMEVAERECAHFLALTDNFLDALSTLDQNVAEQLLELATEIANQLFSGTIEVKNDLLLPVIREAIAALPLHHTHLTLRLNPLDAAAVREQIGESLAQSGTQIIDDVEVSRGGCIVRAGTSEIDASIETRWKRILESIGTTPQEWLRQ